MAGIKKHVGKVRSTDRRCVVVFMQIPDVQDKALIIDVEALQARYEQILLEIVDSAEGQQEQDLANALNRRMVPETGRTVLEEFHRLGLMRAEPIDNIIMMPRPNTPFPLRDILTQLGKLNADATTAPQQLDADVKYNPIVENMNTADKQQRVMMATNLLAEAEMLQAEANKKREQAYRQAPELRPASVVAKEQTIEAATEALLAETPAKRGRGRPPKAATNG